MVSALAFHTPEARRLAKGTGSALAVFAVLGLFPRVRRYYSGALSLLVDLADVGAFYAMHLLPVMFLFPFLVHPTLVPFLIPSALLIDGFFARIFNSRLVVDYFGKDANWSYVHTRLVLWPLVIAKSLIEVGPRWCGRVRGVFRRMGRFAYGLSCRSFRP